jgi:hypothetical protein
MPKQEVGLLVNSDYWWLNGEDLEPEKKEWKGNSTYKYSTSGRFETSGNP